MTPRTRPPTPSEIDALFWAMVLGFSIGLERTITGLRVVEDNPGLPTTVSSRRL